MTVIDLDEYPPDTEQVLISLWMYEQERKNEELQNEWMTRRMVADRTSLNKQKARYRLDKLVENDYVAQDTVTEHNQRVTYYALSSNGREAAKAISEAKDVLGRIPEDVGRQDILKLTKEIAGLRAEIEAAGFELENVDGSKFKKEIDSINNGLEYNHSEIQLNTEDISDLWMAVIEIQKQLGLDTLEH